MNINYNLTEEDYLIFSLYHAKNSTSTQNSLRKQRLIFPLIFLIAAYLFSWIVNRPFIGGPLIVFAIVSVLWIVFYPKYFYNFVTRYAKNMINNGNNNGLLGDHKMTLSENEIMDSTIAGKTKVEWKKIEFLKENDDYLYIYSSAVTAYILPKRALSNIEETRKFINSKIKKPS